MSNFLGEPGGRFPLKLRPQYTCRLPLSESKLEEVPQGLHPILPVDLLAFRIGASIVPYAKLINPHVPLACNAGADFYLDTKVIC
jgi:hypothetical protein